MKSVRLRIAAKLILVIGLLACFLGSAAYCVLTMPETFNLPFDWRYLAITGGAALLFIIISMILLGCSKSAEAREELEMRLMEAQALAEAAEADRVAAELLAAEAQSKECCKKRKTLLPLSREDAEAAKKVGKVILPIAAVCLIGGLAIRSAKKRAKRKRQATVRRALYEFLG